MTGRIKDNVFTRHALGFLEPNEATLQRQPTARRAWHTFSVSIYKYVRMGAR